MTTILHPHCHPHRQCNMLIYQERIPQSGILDTRENNDTWSILVMTPRNLLFKTVHELNHNAFTNSIEAIIFKYVINIGGLEYNSM